MTTFLFNNVQVGSVDLGDQAAHHARVKRMEPGEEIRVTDGAGRVGIGKVEALGKATLRIDINDVWEVEPPEEVHLFVPVADKERMLWVAEKATELQIASWNPVMYERSKSVSTRGEGESFDRKIHARMVGALEQSGGAWLPDIRPIRALDEITGQKGIVLERGAVRFGSWAMTAPVTIAVGPEGGFTPRELAMYQEAGWSMASLGAVTLRFDTAAIGAVAIARSTLS